MKNLYGQLDLTLLGKLVRNHPELVRKAQFRDGEHQLIAVDISARREVDQYGNIANIKASCKRDEQKDGLNYYLANLKESKFQDGQQQQAPPQQQPPPFIPQQPVQYQAQPESSTDDLPF